MQKQNTVLQAGKLVVEHAEFVVTDKVNLLLEFMAIENSGTPRRGVFGYPPCV